MTKGLDYSWARPNLSQVVAQGYSFVCRYLSYLPNGKVIGPDERDSLLSAGIDIALNWENDARDGLGGWSAGDNHGKEAVRQAYNLGYPLGSTIYFSYDWDVSEGDQHLVNDHASAAGNRCHLAGYRMGAYGGYYVVKRLFDAGLIDDGWQAYAWSGGQWDSRAALRQIRNGVNVGGGDCDIDESVGQCYFWNHKSVPVPVPVPLVEDDDMLFAFKELSTETVYISDGYRYRGIATMAALENLIDSGMLRKPVSPQYTPLDNTGYVLVVGDGEKDHVGGVKVV